MRSLFKFNNALSSPFSLQAKVKGVKQCQLMSTFSTTVKLNLHQLV